MSRITEPVDETRLSTLSHNVHPLARAEFDQGVAPPGLPMERMQLVLTRSAEQQAALQQLLDAQQDPASPQYHHWLTPQEFGRQFGVSDQDLATITAWLQSHGFQINHVANGRNLIEFSGTAAQVAEAFHAEIHKYLVNGRTHWANAANPQIPAALAPVVAGVATLHNFEKKPEILDFGTQFEATISSTHSRPQFTSGSTHALTPADYAIIYDINPLYSAAINGTGVAIAVVARSNINASDIASFRSAFGLPSNPPQIIVNGSDPGVVGNGEVDEATLDTSWAGAVAPYATVKLVVSASTNSADGVDLSEEYTIDNNLADIMTESFGSCEADYTAAQQSAISSLAAQAAAQGMTYTVAAGDSGAEGCDDPSSPPATGPLSVNILASTPYNIAVGGTMFNDTANPSLYWASSNGANDESALSYIPENVWNESCDTNCTGDNSAGLWAGGGGASVFVSKPAWQTGVSGIPSDGARDVPDISLTAAGHDAYLLCISGSCTPNSRGRITFQGYGGTSAATPAFAGMMALVVQKSGVRQGQANYTLYRLAAAENFSNCNASNTSGLPASTCIFHDVTSGNNAVPGEAGYGTPTAPYSAGVGYDLATGLGSVDATNLVNAWNQAGAGAPGVSFSPASLPFGSVSVHSSSSLVVIVTNSGSASLAISSVQVTGSNASAFVATNGCTTSVQPGVSCSIGVSFTPTATVTYSATLVISDNASGSPQSIPLTGVGVTGQVGISQATLSSTSVDFGFQMVGVTSATETVIVSNLQTGGATLGLYPISTHGSTDFTAVSNCDDLLPAGASCTISISFTPSSVGAESATVTVRDTGGGIQNIALTGTGVVRFVIMNKLSGKALAVTGGSRSDGATIEQSTYSNDPAQQWQVTPLDSTYYVIWNESSRKVLDDTGFSTTNGTQMQQWTYWGGDTQQWQLISIDGTYYEFINKHSGKALDVRGLSTSDGAAVQQWDYLGGLNQQWQLVPVTYNKIVNKLSGKALDDTNLSLSDGNLIQQWDYVGGTNQQWQLVPSGGPYYAIMNRLSDRVLDDSNFGTFDGNLIQQWDYLSGDNQQWQLVPVGNGYVKIVNKFSGKVLDDTGFSLSNGTLVQQWDDLGGDNQKWQVTVVYIPSS